MSCWLGGDVLEKQAHAGMVFYELSEGHREAVTEKLKTDIEQLRDDFATANIEPPDDLVEFSNYCGTRNRAAEPIGRSSCRGIGTSYCPAHFLCGGGSSIAAAHASF